VKTIVDYASILGVTTSASVEVIRKAYRKRAMELHPDRNKSPDAHDQFILLQEAYDYFLNLKSGKVNTATASTYHQDWYNQRREQARERARQYARMKYEEYLQSDDFKAVSALNNVFDLFGFLILLLLIISIPVLAFLRWQFVGLIVSIIFILAGIPFLFRFMRRAAPDFRQLKSSIKFLFQSRTFWVMIITLVNVFLIIRIDFRTLITPLNLGIFFTGASLLTYTFLKLIIRTRNRFLIFFTWFCLAPMLVNLFFTGNFIFASHPIKESYLYTIITQDSPQGKRPTSTIRLEGDKYREYYFLRFFMDYQDLIVSSQIHYEISEGAFGMRVMKNYRLE
jgi:hypothetical protein